MAKVINSPWVWIALGLIFVAASLTLNDAPVSPFWFADLPLYALMLIGLWRLRAGKPLYLPLSRRAANVAFLTLSWTFGMIYEASLTLDGTGIGGVHPNTRASYILAQGDYILIALTTLLLIRYLRLDFTRTFFIAGGKSLTEGLIFSGILTAIVISPTFWSAPFFLAYYTLAYATFVAMPLLFIDPTSLWKSPTPPSIPIWQCWAIGFVAAFIIRVIWGLGWAPLATRMFDLPPNLPGI
jgi:hypothetical protein